MKPAKFAQNWKICKIRKFAEYCTALKEEVERAWTKPVIFVKFETKLGKHEIDNFKVAPLASVWLPAKCEAIDMKMFFYYSQYANNIHFHKLGFAA